MNKIDLIIRNLEKLQMLWLDPEEKAFIAQALAAARELHEQNKELLEALKFAQAIIGHPDDAGSKFIAAAIAKAEVTK
jgi:hypothetical protein